MFFKNKRSMYPITFLVTFYNNMPKRNPHYKSWSKMLLCLIPDKENKWYFIGINFKFFYPRMYHMYSKIDLNWARDVGKDVYLC